MTKVNGQLRLLRRVEINGEPLDVELEDLAQSHCAQMVDDAAEVAAISAMFDVDATFAKEQGIKCKRPKKHIYFASPGHAAAQSLFQ